MPRVLVVTYQWLPLFNAGVKHVATLCRYLPSTGWEPHILTKDWSEGPAPEDAWLHMSDQPVDASPALKHAAALPVVRAPYALRDNRWLRREAQLDQDAANARLLSPRKIERRALKAASPFYGHYPDMHRGWVEPAVAAGVIAVRQYGIGAVLSVCPPASAHLVGGEIARRAGVAWVTMFADLSVFYQGPGDGRKWSERRKHATLNRKSLQGASRAACVSPNMSDYVRDTYGINGEVVVVPYDPEERRVPPHREADAPLRVVHTGTIRPEADRPEVLFDALDLLLASGSLEVDAIRVDLVGSRHEAALAELLRDRACAPMVHLIENVAPSEAVRMQREADLLVVFSRQDAVAQATGVVLNYPARIFEYLNALRPTVAIAADPSGFVGRLLSETNAGHTAEDAPSLGAVLLDYLTELRTRGRVAFRGDESAIGRYSAQEQAKRLASLLDAASAERFGSWQRA
jgi:glycosyltransferase involved in cell wall biosynthesis